MCGGLYVCISGVKTSGISLGEKMKSKLISRSQ